MKKQIRILLLLFLPIFGFGQDVFINEVNYLSNNQPFFEIAGPPQTDLSDYQVVLYNENGVPYDTIELSGILPETTPCSGIVDVDVAVLYTAPGSGMALIQEPNQVLQYISFGGTAIGDGGPADGLTSDSIGTQLIEDMSLQLGGSGLDYADFAWDLVPSPATPGDINNNQAIECPSGLSTFLPVELASFNGELRDEIIKLTWHTLSEVNHSHFEVMHSNDGISFTNLGRVIEPAIVSGTSRYYDFQVTQPFVGGNYFKLIQVDNDGTTTHTDIIHISYQGVGNKVTVYPNPVNDRLNLKFDSIPDFKNNITIRVVDSFGKTIIMKNVNNQDDLFLSVESLDSGLYFIHLQQLNLSWKASFVKQNF